MKSNKNIELRILKAILWIYILLCILIAGLNYGYASRATPKVASFITWLWQFYENWVKTLFIIIGSFLTIRIIGTSKRSVMRKRNLIGFIVSALIVHITAPILLNNKELYFFAMPLPWTTIPLQLLFPKSSFYLSSYPIWGEAGISAALIFYVCVSIVVLVGTLLFGRRLQCSTLCLFNGFASEVFDPVIPLIGKNKKINPIVIKIFSVLRWVFLLISVFFTVCWISLLLGTPISGNFQMISKIENYKYLTTELMIAMFFWVAFIGRGYCYYCPLGTVLSFLGKIADQRIITNKSKCIQCGQCNLACPMSIDIKSKAQSGDDVINIRCVGCGHCVDACPVKTLAYSTRFSNWILNKIK
ncbi:4Fe-4S dicluster domain-containing protein [Clostridium estertheticum]|uniref:4Fe-4S dicluster domain-containing protein n=1 Tax=Clostridium estertheticum TaxID=238834 RepID=A0A5N7IZH2_9CLOT|nr:4Fe-4S binding protein [Clostridium estertheticum]MPQ31188.1 4Fe-4S dicluster domain-containing protein [Clostridium estertheticum]MPQ61863.1 4Fe-4S dicluster domain-containing protein [Clostridium estertheticum]